MSRTHRRRRLVRAVTKAANRAPEPVALPLHHPAYLLACLALAASLVATASYRLYETDLWQHLVMGRAIWEHGLPRTNQWTWSQYGEPYFFSSWGFRALSWPLWTGAGVIGLFVWRWITTLAVFGILLATARFMGARGLFTFVVLAWAAIGYRLRTDMRPETLASIFLALEMLLLERQRRTLASPGRSLWVIPALVCLWANIHISVYLAFVVLGFYTVDAWWTSRAHGERGAASRARSRRLVLIGIASFAAALLNPFGWVTLLQAVQFALVWSRDPLMRTIGELQPVPLREALMGGVLVWPLLALVRIRRRGLDVVEALACAFSTWLAFSSYRFSGTYWIIASPFLARDLHEWITARRWPVPRLKVAARAALTVAAIALIGWPSWTSVTLPLSISIDTRTYPARACDFMADHGIRGRGLNTSSYGGYQAFRFWPERDRLPFISTQAEYTPVEDRTLLLGAMRTEAGWRALDDKHDFDYVMVERDQVLGDSLLDFLDRDPRFAMVFADDAAELLVRRDRFAALVDSFGYRAIPAGRAGRYSLGPRCQNDLELRLQAERELDRMIAESPINAGASHLRGFLALMDSDLDTARRHLERALAINPLLPNLHNLLGTMALQQGRWADAIRELDTERRLHDPPGGLFFRTAVAWQQLGRFDRARDFYRRELDRDPAFSPAADSLAALDARHP